MRLTVPRILLLLGAILITPNGSFAQVFNTGPDDASLFFISFDEDTNRGFDTFDVTFGNADGSQNPARQFNILPGGLLGGEYAGGVELNIRGGGTDAAFSTAGSEVNLIEGFLGVSFYVDDGSQVNIFGGVVGTGFQARFGSEINVQGGTFQTNFQAQAGSVVNLFGQEFFLDGVSVFDSGVFTGTQVIDARGSVLSGLLSDGTPFSFELNSNDPGDVNSEDFFSPDSTLSVTLAVPEPDLLLGDCNHDGVVNFLDIAPFIAILSAGDFLAEADINEDGNVDFLDIGPFIAILSGQ